MRITNAMLSDVILKNISSSYERIGKFQDQLSSGKLYNKPSDNPVAINKGLGIRSVTKSLDQYVDNVNDALAWLKTADGALMNTVDLLYRAKELSVQGANGTNTQEALNAIAKEIDQIIEDTVSIGNTQYDGKYIFGGNRTTTAPFTLVAGPPTDVTYNGDSASRSYEIEKGVTVTVNLTGDTVFKDSTDPTSIFRILIDLRDHLTAGDFAALSTDTSQIDSAITTVTDGLMVVGAKVNRLEIAMDRLEDEKFGLIETLSNIEDADIAEVITKLKMEETVYQAALAAGSTAIQKSLIDFLKL